MAVLVLVGWCEVRKMRVGVGEVVQGKELQADTHMARQLLHSGRDSRQCLKPPETTHVVVEWTIEQQEQE